MAKFKKRLQAITLRKKGYSIKSISEKLDVSKGSVSIWCRDIILTEKQKNILRDNMIKAGHKGRMIGAEINRKKREDNIAFFREFGKNEIGQISRRDLLIAGIALYWGEGSKSDKTSLAFVNSDPSMIKFMYRWFNEVMGVKKEEFMPRIFINEIHRPRIKVVLNFWSSFLDLPISQFGNPVFLKMKQKKIYDNYNVYYGVLALKVRKSSNLKYKILGLIKALSLN